MCPHCDQYVSKSSYYRHRSAFYDRCSKNWSKTLRTNNTSEEDEVSGSESSQSNNAADCDSLGSDIDKGKYIYSMLSVDYWQQDIDIDYETQAEVPIILPHDCHNSNAT